MPGLGVSMWGQNAYMQAAFRDSGRTAPLPAKCCDNQLWLSFVVTSTGLTIPRGTHQLIYCSYIYILGKGRGSAICSNYLGSDALLQTTAPREQRYTAVEQEEIR